MSELPRSERKTQNRVIVLFTDKARPDCLGYRNLESADNRMMIFREIAATGEVGGEVTGEVGKAQPESRPESQPESRPESRRSFGENFGRNFDRNFGENPGYLAWTAAPESQDDDGRGGSRRTPSERGQIDRQSTDSIMKSTVTESTDNAAVFSPEAGRFWLTFAFAQPRDHEEATELGSGKTSANTPLETPVETRRKTSVKTSVKTPQTILEDEEITIPDLAKLVEVTTRSVERNIRKLQEEKKLRRVGPDKGGRWEVLK